MKDFDLERTKIIECGYTVKASSFRTVRSAAPLCLRKAAAAGAGAAPGAAGNGRNSAGSDTRGRSPRPEEEFVVSEEVYTKTFDEIEEFIRNLNEIIRSEDYDTWLTFLSEDYIQRTSDPAYLKRQSEQPLLKKSSISLNSLKDYFDHVVVPSRVQAQLDEIEFVDENQVKAYAMIRNTKALLFLLVRENDKWKIGVW